MTTFTCNILTFGFFRQGVPDIAANGKPDDEITAGEDSLDDDDVDVDVENVLLNL